MTMKHKVQGCQLYHNQRVSTWPTDICPCSTAPMILQNIAGLSTLPQPKGANLAHRHMSMYYSPNDGTSHIAGQPTLYSKQRVSTWPTNICPCSTVPMTVQHTPQDCQLYQNQSVNLAHIHLPMQYSPNDDETQTAGLSTLPQPKGVCQPGPLTQQRGRRLSAQWRVSGGQQPSPGPPESLSERTTRKKKKTSAQRH